MRQSRSSDAIMRFVSDSAFFVRSRYYRLRYRRARQRADGTPVRVTAPLTDAPSMPPPPTISSLPSTPPLRPASPAPSVRLSQLLVNVPRPPLRLAVQHTREFFHHVWQGDSILRGAGWLAIIIAPLLIAVATPIALEGTVSLWRNMEKQWRMITSGGGIAPFFAPSVQYWADDIVLWATEHDLDPNLLATVMQIESCGHPTVSSSAGAQGLFQVMPFHFEADENQLDPATNAYRGATFLAYCQRSAGGNAGLAMACYNGGPSVLGRDFGNWAQETQRYYLWGVGIYQEAQSMQNESVALNNWWQAGGARLCRLAEGALGA